MASGLEALAKKIKAKKASAGIVQIWGGNLSRPGDVIYELSAVTAIEGKSLRLELTTEDGAVPLVIELDQPGGAKFEGDEVKVAAAVCVRVNGLVREKLVPRSLALYLV